MSRGGARPGAGRKRTNKISVSIRLTKEQYLALKELRRGDINTRLGEWITEQFKKGENE